MGYRATTGIIKQTEKGDTFSVSSYRHDIYVNDRTGIELDKDEIERNPDWFEKLPKWRIEESPLGNYYVTDGRKEIYEISGDFKFYFPEDVAKGIADVLNELDQKPE